MFISSKMKHGIAEKVRTNTSRDSCLNQ